MSKFSNSRMWRQPATAKQIATLKRFGNYDGKYFSKGRAGQTIGNSKRAAVGSLKSLNGLGGGISDIFDAMELLDMFANKCAGCGVSEPLFSSSFANGLCQSCNAVHQASSKMKKTLGIGNEFEDFEAEDLAKLTPVTVIVEAVPDDEKGEIEFRVTEEYDDETMVDEPHVRMNVVTLDFRKTTRALRKAPEA
ncbi:hypothetical protein FACS1894104_5210 [Actinomycetota bacterium]|nr:hypothetical protein FACS1894104_5210 [Actinomycetota bacterium]